jgi:hypothetical protein
MKANDLYHFGLVAHDYEATQAQFTSLFGYRWGDEIHLTALYETKKGDRNRPRCMHRREFPRHSYDSPV